MVLIPFYFLEIVALCVYKLNQTSIIARLSSTGSDIGTLSIESKSPAPAILSRSSRVELDLTARS